MKAAEMFDLTGRVALVTGASSGLGVRFAQCWRRIGADERRLGRRAVLEPDRDLRRAVDDMVGGDDVAALVVDVACALGLGLL